MKYVDEVYRRSRPSTAPLTKLGGVATAFQNLPFILTACFGTCRPFPFAATLLANFFLVLQVELWGLLSPGTVEYE